MRLLVSILNSECACDAIAKKKEDGHWEVDASTEIGGEDEETAEESES